MGKRIGLKGGPNYMVKDQQGQWKYPGQNTRIEGNDVTMKGVPYPVWAQPNVGPPTLMNPGKDYYFPNADYVDEFPIPSYQTKGEVNNEPTRVETGTYNYNFDKSPAEMEAEFFANVNSYDDQGNPLDKSGNPITHSNSQYLRYIAAQNLKDKNTQATQDKESYVQEKRFQEAAPNWMADKGINPNTGKPYTVEEFRALNESGQLRNYIIGDNGERIFVGNNLDEVEIEHVTKETQKERDRKQNSFNWLERKEKDGFFEDKYKAWNTLSNSTKETLIEFHNPYSGFYGNSARHNQNPIYKQAILKGVNGEDYMDNYGQQITDAIVKPGMAVAALPLIASTLPYVGAVGSELYGGVVSPLLNTKIAGDITVGGAMDAYGLYHGATHLPGDVQKMYNDPSWGNALDIGIDALGIGAGAYTTGKQIIPSIKKGYNTVATGNSPLPIAWKSGLNEGNINAAYQGSKNFDALKGANLTDDEAAIVRQYLHSPQKMSEIDRAAFNKIVQDNKLTDQMINSPVSRIQNYHIPGDDVPTSWGSKFNFDRPVSWSVGSKWDGAGYNGVGNQRIVIPEKYANQLGSEFFKVPISENKNLQHLIENTNVGSFKDPRFQKVNRLLDEKELIGNPNFKVIGTDNTGHFNDIIVKPIKTNKTKTNWTKPTKDYLKKEYDIEIRKKGLTDLISEEEFITQGLNAPVQSINNTSSIRNRTFNKTREEIINQSQNYKSWPEFRNEGTIDDIYTGFKKGNPMKPIILMDQGTDGTRIISGNTRLNVAEQLNKSPFAITLKGNKPKGVSDLITDKSDEFGDIVEVLTADGSKKLMSKKDALKFSRIEDANLNQNLINKSNEYEMGNWFNIGLDDASSQMYYLRNTKDALKGPGNSLTPEANRRLISGFIDPADAEMLNVANSTERAKTLSGGIDNTPLSNEYIFPPTLVEKMRKGVGSGYTTTTGDFKTILKNLSDFENLKNGGQLPKAQNGKEPIRVKDALDPRYIEYMDRLALSKKFTGDEGFVKDPNSNFFIKNDIKYEITDQAGIDEAIEYSKNQPQWWFDEAAHKKDKAAGNAKSLNDYVQDKGSQYAHFGRNRYGYSDKIHPSIKPTDTTLYRAVEPNEMYVYKTTKGKNKKDFTTMQWPNHHVYKYAAPEREVIIDPEYIPEGYSYKVDNSRDGDVNDYFKENKRITREDWIKATEYNPAKHKQIQREEERRVEIPEFVYGGQLPKAQDGKFIKNASEILSKAVPPAPATTKAMEEMKLIQRMIEQRDNTIPQEMLVRQAFKESTFNPDAVSSAGYKGMSQLGDAVISDYKNATGATEIDPFDPEDAAKVQKWYMDNLYNSSFVNKPNQSAVVRKAKAFGAYNWGRGNMADFLNEQKEKGVDIYSDDMKWLESLPTETKDYINKIVLENNEKFEKEYLDSKHDSINKTYYNSLFEFPKRQFGGEEKSDSVYVSQGEIGPRIASKFGITIQELLDANPGINPMMIAKGTSINIPGMGSSIQQPIVEEVVTPVAQPVVTPSVQPAAPVVTPVVTPPVQQTVQKPIVKSKPQPVVNTQNKITSVNTPIEPVITQQQNKPVNPKAIIKAGTIGPVETNEIETNEATSVIKGGLTAGSGKLLPEIDFTQYEYKAFPSSTGVVAASAPTELYNPFASVYDSNPVTGDNTTVFINDSLTLGEQHNAYNPNKLESDHKKEQGWFEKMGHWYDDKMDNLHRGWVQHMDGDVYNTEEVNVNIDLEEEPEGFGVLKSSTNKGGVDGISGAAASTVSAAIEETKPTTTVDNIKPVFKNLGTVNDSKGKLMMFQNSFNAKKGFNYVPIMNYGKSTNSTQYDNVKGIAHFLLDSDLTDGYKHEYASNMIKNQLDGISVAPGSTVKDGYYPIYEKLDNGQVNIKYLKKDEIKDYTSIASPLRQYRWSDLDWEGKTTAQGFKTTVSSIPTVKSYTANGKKSNSTHLIFPTSKDRGGKGAYGRFGGTGVIFFIEKPNGQREAIEMAGSINMIKETANEIMKKYKLKPEQLIFGYHDVGSFSARPQAKNGKLNFNQWSGFNQASNPHVGGALAFPLVSGNNVELKFGGQINKNEVYKNYIKGKYDNTDKLAFGKEVYDKLNRLHYKDAKKLGMHIPNYVMTHVVGKGNK
tara:strand:+ start:3361 stop:9717 length:6357 start_codon:yes stop_codon:yes gene_type:complete